MKFKVGDLVRSPFDPTRIYRVRRAYSDGMEIVPVVGLDSVEPHISVTGAALDGIHFADEASTPPATPRQEEGS